MSQVFQGTVEQLSLPLPVARFKWDAETEILACRLEGANGAGGYTGTIELEDPGGPIIALDMQAGTLAAVEIVVWPEVETVAHLRPPAPHRSGRMHVPPRASQPGIALTEVELAMQGRRAPDEAVIHLAVGPRRKTQVIQLAEGLLLELDQKEQPAGFWMVGVPPFPKGDAVR